MDHCPSQAYPNRLPTKGRPMKRFFDVDRLLGQIRWGIRLKREKLKGQAESKSQFLGVSKPGCFPLFSGKVQIVSRTLWGLFLVGALDRPRKRKGTNRENPRANRENPGKIGKVPKRTKKDKKGRTSPDRETPPFETPPFGGP